MLENKLKHTKGPWEQHSTMKECVVFTNTNGERENLLTQNHEGYFCLQKEEDARLIACAPEILALLLDLYKLDFMDNPDKRATALFTATLLEKATGQKIEDLIK